MNKLPISVIIPTLNCREKLEQHLDASEEWLSEVAEVIAVDSKSNDGTYEVLKSSLSRYDAELIASEKGLYRSWNKAIALASQPYTYISTIGDIIRLKGLRKLYNNADRESADVVISVPQMVNEFGNPVSNKWPIHHLKEYIDSVGGVFLPSSLQLIKILNIFLPESIIGSSASNLYKTSALQKNAFNENVGKSGDVLWALQNLSIMKVCILSDELATFMWDGERACTWKQHLATLKKYQDIIRSSHIKENTEIISLETTLINYLHENNQKLMHECHDLEKYTSVLKENINIVIAHNRLQQLIDKAFTYTSIRYWLSKIQISKSKKI